MSGGVYGGRINSGSSQNNIITLADSTVGDVFGSSSSGTNGNTLNLFNGNEVTGRVGNFETIKLQDSYTDPTNTVTVNLKWDTEKPLLSAGSFTNYGTLDISDAAATLKAATPGTMTLLKSNTANAFQTLPLKYWDGEETLEAANDSVVVYSAAAQDTDSGVTLDYNAIHTVSINLDGANTYQNVTYTVGGQANSLTFGDVEWKDSGALIDHSTKWADISFSGANVDTTNINFTNLAALKDSGTMTLVSSFGDTVGTITGTKYKVGSTLEGTGKASLVDGDLIFTTDAVPTDDGGTDDSGNSGGLTVQEQTHNTVMGATVSLATLSAGNDFIGSATEGLAQVANIGDDGISSYANIGGGSMRQETGSHVDTHVWNAILALGRKNKKEKSTFEYGAFFEYGSGNYTTHNGDERGDGSARYTGGGLLAKWTAKHGFYVEGSLRAGTVHDDARNVLRDANGVPYSYETNANYFGGHIGVGKEIALANGNTVDVYGKYFVNRRNSVDFNAGGHYDLDAVTSQIARIGARYTVKGKKWNFYAGAAYEHEFDGKARGTADGFAIRGADTSGGSFRGELGATVTPGENSPWKLDLNVTGFAGKKQGVTGGVSVAFMF